MEPTRREREWVECWACGGSGEDDTHWDGFCFRCGGNGEYLCDVAAWDDDDDADSGAGRRGDGESDG